MKPAHRRVLLAAFALCSLLAAPAVAQESIGPTKKYAVVADELSSLIEHIREIHNIPSVTIALVDDQEIVWAKGFGVADPATGRPATATTVGRVGSVSKLFTDIAAMQLVEEGKLDIDQPVSEFIAGIAIEEAPGRAFTLRQLMGHRAGIVREPPVGNYFDPTGPTPAETVASLNGTGFVYEPGTRTKYSNAGITIVGEAVRRVSGEPFDQRIRSKILEPLGMSSSGFTETPAMVDAVGKGVMWTLDGRTFPAPLFRMGIAPAGELESTAVDLARFESALFAGGKGPGGMILKAETFAKMLEPQAADAGFGVGFAVGKWRGFRRAGHGGAVYGFATDLSMLPDEKLGVVVIASRDCANSQSTRIADEALAAMILARDGQPIVAPERTTPVDPTVARKVAGRYGNETDGVDLIERNGRLYVFPHRGGSIVEVRAKGDGFVTDSPLAFGRPLRVVEDTVEWGGKTLERVKTDTPPEAIPDRWKGLIGEYGWDHNTLYILEREGQLWALIEWFFEYPLTEESPDLFRFPDWGLYDGETIAFRRDDQGRATEARAATVAFKRRPIEGEDGATFRITPVKPVAALRAEIAGAAPPAEAGEFRDADLVELTALDPTIQLEIRYATDNNFLGTPVYTVAKAYMQRPAAEALVKAHQALSDRGFGLLIHDAYRPWAVTKLFWDATPESGHGFVADPSKGSKHNRGCAVDLSLYDLKTGEPVRMVGGYDEFSNRSNPDYPGGTAAQRWRRDLLRRAMEDEGFHVNEVEWWHFDFRDWASYPILNQSFETLGGAGR